MYNQNTVKDPVTGRVRGALYTNPIDCLYKTFRAEGIAGWYKGKLYIILEILRGFVLIIAFQVRLHICLEYGHIQLSHLSQMSLL